MAGHGLAGKRVAPGARRLAVDDPYTSAKSSLLAVVASANGVRAVWDEAFAQMTLIGFRSDLEVVEMLYTSLLMQASRAMLGAGRIIDERGRSRTRSFRQSFYVAFSASTNGSSRHPTRRPPRPSRISGGRSSPCWPAGWRRWRRPSGCSPTVTPAPRSATRPDGGPVGWRPVGQPRAVAAPPRRRGGIAAPLVCCRIAAERPPAVGWTSRSPRQGRVRLPIELPTELIKQIAPGGGPRVDAGRPAAGSRGAARRDADAVAVVSISQDGRMLDVISLGRSVVVGPGQPAPGEWSQCDRVRVTAVESTVADELGAAWRERRSVGRAHPGLGLDDPEHAPGRSGDGAAAVGVAGRSRPGGRAAPPRGMGQRGRRPGRDPGDLAVGRGRLPSGGPAVGRRRRSTSGWPTGRRAVCDGGPSTPAWDPEGGTGGGPPDQLSNTGPSRPLGPNVPVGWPWPPTSWRRSRRPGPGPGSSPRPGRGRRGSSPSGPGCCSGHGGSRPRPWPWWPTTCGPPMR